jgi:HPt (histidine-containing phosphotransfer) domain-containing protein
VLDKFEERLRNDWTELQEAVAASDSRRVATLAHSLKGSAGNVAATEISQVAGELERAARGQSLGSADATLERMNSEIERCLQWMTESLTAVEERT